MRDPHKPWCDCCGTGREPEPIHAHGHRAVVTWREEVLCLDCCCSNPRIASEDWCFACLEAVAEITKDTGRP